MSDFFSADTDDLDRFVATSQVDVSLFRDTHDELRAGRAYLASLPLQGFVEHSTLDRYRDLVEFMTENGRFVSQISGALKSHGDHFGNGMYRADVDVVDAELAKTDTERLDGLERNLVQRGMDPAEAAKVRAEVLAQMEADPTLSFREATLAGVAAYQGISLAEAEQASRAFDLYPAEVSAIVEEHFDDIAGRRGNRDQITIKDLHEIIEDESTPVAVRDAAYRLAADQNLFNNMDVAKQTDLSAEPFGSGFNLAEIDGIIGRDDVIQFADKDYQARILLAWHPLVETAAQDYDLSRADSHAGEDDIAAFVEDEDIPAYIRLAVFDAYSERYNLDLTEREVLEQELAFDGSSYAGRSTYFDVTGRPTGGRLPAVSLTGDRPAGGARPGQSGTPRGGSGGAAAAAIYAQLLAATAGFGWRQGRQARIERDGNPQFVHGDPITGQETTIDLSELADLTPAEAKAYIAYFATHGFPPPTITDSIEPHPYLDANGQWRMSDTNEPVHNVDQDGDTGPVPLQNPDQYYDGQGNLRWKDTNQLVSDVPVRPQYRDRDGTWRWADTQEPVEEVSVIPTGTVWDDVIPTDSVYPETVVPRSFRLVLDDGTEIWVHPNATKHLAQYALRPRLTGPVATQGQIRSLQTAISELNRRGVSINKLYYINGWELQFGIRSGDELVVLNHALYRG